jgi:hypothetical protein
MNDTEWHDPSHTTFKIKYKNIKEKAHPIHNQQFSTDILASAAREKHDGPGKVRWEAPSSGGDPF